MLMELMIKLNWFTIRFKNAATQIPTVEQFLPIKPVKEKSLQILIIFLSHQKKKLYWH